MELNFSILQKSSLPEKVGLFLKEFLSRINEEKIQVVLLTGSWKWNTARSDSDVDIVVIVNDQCSDDDIWQIRDVISDLNICHTNNYGKPSKNSIKWKKFGLVNAPDVCRYSEVIQGLGWKLKSINPLLIPFLPMKSYLAIILDNSEQIYGNNLLPKLRYDISKRSELIKGLISCTFRSITCWSVSYFYGNPPLINAYCTIRAAAIHCFFLTHRHRETCVCLEPKSVFNFYKDEFSSSYLERIMVIRDKGYRNFKEYRIDILPFLFLTTYYVVKIYFRAFSDLQRGSQEF